MWKWVLALMITFTGNSVMAQETSYAEGIEHARTERVARLKQPLGWLSLVGLNWIEPGRHSIGHADDNAIVLAIGPAHLGEIVRDGEQVSLELAEDSNARVDGKPASGVVQLVPDTLGAPTVVSFDEGSRNFNLIVRSGHYGLRVRDSQAATRTQFAGIDFYPPDESWRVHARFEPHPPGTTIPIANVVGQLEDTPNLGTVTFERDGKTHRLEALEEDGTLFFVFADRTSGKDTYGAGRQLNAPMPTGSEAIIDFNLAYNPPCAFNAYSTCPLPPPENRLDLAVTAGEKKYRGAH
jgi:uncharacterized protein (DUF1684 family)